MKLYIFFIILHHDKQWSVGRGGVKEFIKSQTTHEIGPRIEHPRRTDHPIQRRHDITKVFASFQSQNDRRPFLYCDSMYDLVGRCLRDASSRVHSRPVESSRGRDHRRRRVVLLRASHRRRLVLMVVGWSSWSSVVGRLTTSHNCRPNRSSEGKGGH